MLTPRQHAVYEFIVGFLEAKGHSPSYDEIRRHFRFRSTNAVAKLIDQLRKRGALREAPFNAKRNLSPVRLRSRPRPVQAPVFRNEPATLPLLGLIAAGHPIEAIENPEPVDVPASLLGPGERYVLRVRGDSMVEDGIHNGDLVVIRQAREAENGQTVVAVVNGEATLKRFFRRGPRVELKPANAALKPMQYAASHVEIRGILVGLLRRYA